MKRDWKMKKLSIERYLVYNDELKETKYVKTQEEALKLRNKLNRIHNITEELCVLSELGDGGSK